MALKLLIMASASLKHPLNRIKSPEMPQRRSNDFYDFYDIINDFYEIC